MSFRLSDEQIEVLLRPIKSQRVGRTPQGYAHVEAWDIRAMLIRIFGFCEWSLIETSPPVCLFERERKLSSGKDGIAVAYRAHLALVIHFPDGDATYAGSAVGEAVNQIGNLGDAHDQALKSAESGALKRAATNLGDQFGLSLYDGGSLAPVVKRIVGFTPAAGEPEPAVGVDAAIPPVASPERDQGESTPALPGPPINDALLRLSAPQRVEVARWAKDNGINNIYAPEDEETKNKILIHIEEMVS